MTSAAELARLVRAARMRAFECTRHGFKAHNCPDCMVERVFRIQVRSLAEIMDGYR